MRVAARVEELLSLIGMEPAQYGHRFPRELSGGQKQRVGVARALAADPPVMLMDEPFGALDPITRAHLQTEFLRILRGLRKTIVFVTHDIDEAIKMGDRIAILNDGRLVQYDSPEIILAAPANAFVSEFVGSDRALKRLALIPAADIMTVGGSIANARPRLAADASARDALSAMLAAGADSAMLLDERGAVRGTVTLAALRERLVAPHDRGAPY